jgi:hypothetical protein
LKPKYLVILGGGAILLGAWLDNSNFLVGAWGLILVIRGLFTSGSPGKMFSPGLAIIAVLGFLFAFTASSFSGLLLAIIGSIISVIGSIMKESSNPS